MSSYTASARKVGRYWEVYVPQLDRTTQVTRLDQIDETVRDLVRLTTDEDPEHIDVVHDVVLPPSVARGIAAARESRERAQLLSTKAATDIATVARDLKAGGFTVRDIGAVLGVSFQRAQQLTRGRTAQASESSR